MTLSPTGHALFDDPDDADGPPTGPSRTRSLVEWVAVVVGAVVVALLIKTFVLQAFYIPSESMVPTLMGGPGIPVGDRVFVNKLSYHLHGVNRGDIVVFDRPPLLEADPEVDQLIKRVIGLPGDSITFGPTDHRVYVNGQPLDEPWLPTGVQTDARNRPAAYTPRCGATDPCVVPPGSIWVMGDNRPFSEDSRFFGPISQDLIVGRAFVIVWPLSRFGGL